MIGNRKNKIIAKDNRKNKAIKGDNGGNEVIAGDSRKNDGQDRMETVRQRSIHWSKRSAVLGMSAVIILITAGGVFYAMHVKAAGNGEQSEVTITAGSGEEIIYGQLTSVIGNEITCLDTDSKEPHSYQIPVGTQVVTRLGTVTTFSRLSEGNSVAILVKEGTDNIKKVWIVN